MVHRGVGIFDPRGVKSVLPFMDAVQVEWTVALFTVPDFGFVVDLHVADRAVHLSLLEHGDQGVG